MLYWKGGAVNVEALLDDVLGKKVADELELVAIRSREELTRFTGCQIHQNVAAVDTTVHIRAWADGKTGVATTNDLTAEGLARAARDAAEIARAQTRPAGYAPPDPRPVEEAAAWDEATWEASPAERAALVARAVQGAAALGFNASGSLATGGGEVWVRTTRGIDVHHRTSSVRFVTVIVGKSGGSGYAEFSGIRLSEFVPEEAAERALAKARQSEVRRALEPGEYTVVLEEPAVATLLGMLSSMGFSARALLEKRSFLDGKFGQKLVSDLVTVYDDGLHPQTTVMPFDFEGMPKQRVYFFRAGVAEGVVHDTRTAALLNTTSTGHALPPPAVGWSPMPTHVVMEPGTTPDDELVSGVKRGLLVTRFHYARTVDPMRGVMTMMTRDGTFLIEEGRVREAVEDMRITESGLRALSLVEAVGREQRLITHGEGFGAYLVPKVRIAKFAFTGRTERM
ncbi:TldD/PmbA family protein [Candidatus Bipolaricaulota bacterium]|nr:TldD/PmbA family protein [Candidatus Bipolaricaulota bacterium]